MSRSASKNLKELVLWMFYCTTFWSWKSESSDNRSKTYESLHHYMYITFQQARPSFVDTALFIHPEILGVFAAYPSGAIHPLFKIYTLHRIYVPLKDALRSLEIFCLHLFAGLPQQFHVFFTQVTHKIPCVGSTLAWQGLPHQWRKDGWGTICGYR